ncbi:MAG TPA: alpha/beta hydrolase [Methylocella sp.]|nr:alpha/beta hydrolase [Methylocella sp.]
MWIGIEIAIGVYCALVAGLFIFQRRLMYFPAKMTAPPSAFGLKRVQDIFVETSDKLKLQTWVHPARAGRPTILYFHGNALHLGKRAAWFHAFIDAGFGLVAVSHRGFGKSEGSPTEAGLYADARAAIEYAQGTLKIPSKQLIYFGESLGSGVAVQMATERPPGLLVLQAPHTSVETRAAELCPFLIGVRHLVRDKYDSLSKIASVEAPLLILHGAKDAIIPLRHGETLFAAANQPKAMVVYSEVHHDDFSGEQILTPFVKTARTHGHI